MRKKRLSRSQVLDLAVEHHRRRRLRSLCSMCQAEFLPLHLRRAWRQRQLPRVQTCLPSSSS
jgi:hypothetical protein